MSTHRPQQRRGLGRGLGSLIPTAPQHEQGSDGDGGAADPSTSGQLAPGGSGVELAPVAGAHFAEIAVDQIRPNRVQPRQVFDLSLIHI